MNPAYKKVKAKVETLAVTWENMLDLPGITVEHKFHESDLDPENADTTAAVTKVSYPYRWAIVHWYLPNLTHVPEKELEQLVIHEYCHILNAPMANRTKDDSEDYVEAATENVARALYSVYHKGL